MAELSNAPKRNRASRLAFYVAVAIFSIVEVSAVVYGLSHRAGARTVMADAEKIKLRMSFKATMFDADKMASDPLVQRAINFGDVVVSDPDTQKVLGQVGARYATLLTTTVSAMGLGTLGSSQTLGGTTYTLELGPIKKTGDSLVVDGAFGEGKKGASFKRSLSFTSKPGTAFIAYLRGQLGLPGLGLVLVQVPVDEHPTRKSLGLPPAPSGKPRG